MQMWRSKKWIKGFLPVLVTGLLTNCVSFSTFQRAQTLDPGEFDINLGLLTFIADGEIGGALPEAGMRVGVSDRVDVGAKVMFPGAIFADVKIELIQSPVTLSFDLGYSVISTKNDDEVHLNKTEVVYPMLLLGRETWYFGVKSMYLKTGGETDFFGVGRYEHSAWSTPSMVVGKIIGTGRAKALTEVNIYVSGDGSDLFLAPGLALQFTL